MSGVVEIRLHGRQRQFIINIQYHGYWCPGDVRSQGISSYGIDLVPQVETSDHVLRYEITLSITRLLCPGTNSNPTPIPSLIQSLLWLYGYISICIYKYKKSTMCL